MASIIAWSPALAKPRPRRAGAKAEQGEAGAKRCRRLLRRAPTRNDAARLGIRSPFSKARSVSVANTCADTGDASPEISCGFEQPITSEQNSIFSKAELALKQ